MKIYKIMIVALGAFFVFGCNAIKQQAEATPTDTLKTFIEATKKKDTEAVKRTLSKATLAIIEESAKKQNTTVDELLKKEGGVPIKELPETRNEKIEGDAASVEVKNVITGDFDRVPFVREEGVWKIALDKFMDDVMKKAREQMTMPAPPPADDSSADAPKSDDSSPKSATGKPKADK